MLSLDQNVARFLADNEFLNLSTLDFDKQIKLKKTWLKSIRS
jgi:hypothetical protein